MLAIYGTDLFGKVDRVPGLFHVATQFEHIYWFPVLPKQAYLIAEERCPQNVPPMVPIRWSGKSLFLTWGRGAVLVFGCVLYPFFVLMIFEYLTKPVASIVLLTMLASPLVSLVLFILSYRYTRANPERALELARLVGISPEVVARHLAGSVPPEEEDRLRNRHSEKRLQSDNDS